jgi:thioredoxin reductase (NADPH)
MTKKQIIVNTENFCTSQPAIFAIGDVNTYPGKRKLIVSAFHEATLAAYGVAALVYPGQKIALEYTTASPRLHHLLGVTSS